jgi:superoxide reductase
MPTINHYQNIDEVEREARKDYIDRHSPFVIVEGEAKAGEPYAVTVQVGDQYTHPDDFDHYISSIALYNGQTKIAEATLFAGALGGQDKKGNARVTFNVVFDKKAKLVAHAYCTKHGVWESDPVEVAVS